MNLDNPILPNCWIMNRACENPKNLLILRFGENIPFSKGGQILPDYDGMNSATTTGNIVALEWGMNKFIFPTYLGLVSAMKKGHVSVLKWCVGPLRKFFNEVKLELKSRCTIRTDLQIESQSIEEYNLKLHQLSTIMLNEIYIKINILYPDKYLIKIAADHGQLEIIKWVYYNTKKYKVLDSCKVNYDNILKIKQNLLLEQSNRRSVNGFLQENTATSVLQEKIDALSEIIDFVIRHQSGFAANL